MKKIWFLAAAALWPAALLNAQTDGLAKDVQLQEAVVKGARVVSRPDGILIYPSEEMKNAATSGYNLLRMLPLPNVKVDDVNESIVALIPLSAPCWCVSTVWWLRRTTSGRYAPRRWRRSSLLTVPACDTGKRWAS
ncbi:MAG: hypothetical protein MR624_00850 [Bacteroidales bacterium]|nr:hypothetical protein [Bacteroidales bacterium]MCI6251564.1 hypothetical protein [Bacteroidales bacterium]